MLDIRRLLEIFLQLISCLQAVISDARNLSELEEGVASAMESATHGVPI